MASIRDFYSCSPGVLSLVGFTKVVFPKLFSLNGDRQAFANEYHSALNNVFLVIKAGWCWGIIA